MVGSSWGDRPSSSDDTGADSAGGAGGGVSEDAAGLVSAEETTGGALSEGDTGADSGGNSADASRGASHGEFRLEKWLGVDPEGVGAELGAEEASVDGDAMLGGSDSSPNKRLMSRSISRSVGFGFVCRPVNAIASQTRQSV